MMSELGIYKDISHPFDRESQLSLEHLFTSFCNHVTLGQWELARACLRGLYEKRKLLNKPLKEILRALIDQPTLVR
jgi:zinc finger FYVE domain-containing protein 26